MDFAKVLQHARPFAEAPSDAVEEIARSATVRELANGDTLWRAGDQPTYFTIISRGLLKIVRSLPNGRDAIMGLFGPRESIGDVAVLQNTPLPAAAVVCSVSASVIRVPRAVVLDAMTRSAGLSLSINRAIGDRVHALHTKVEILSAGGVEARLAALLLELSERFGDELEDGTVGIPIVLSRQDLANLVSTTFETTIRVMSRWQKSGWVDTQADGFVIRNLPELQQTARTVKGKV